MHIKNLFLLSYLSFCFILFFEKGSHVAQAGLELPIPLTLHLPKLALQAYAIVPTYFFSFCFIVFFLHFLKKQNLTKQPGACYVTQVSLESCVAHFILRLSTILLAHHTLYYF